MPYTAAVVDLAVAVAAAAGGSGSGFGWTSLRRQRPPKSLVCSTWLVIVDS